MDSVGIAILVCVLVALIAVGAAVAALKIWLRKKKKSLRARGKGARGEYAVANILGHSVDGVQYVINDLLFDTGEDKSCQIDHVLINHSGIWVIETKNYAGLILGGEDQREWTQVLAGGNVRNKLYNPIKQNLTHIYNLADYLHAGHIFHNVVVFLPNADISNVHYPEVYTIEELRRIKTAETGIHLSSEEMELFYSQLLNLRDSATVTHAQHVRNIREQQEQLESGICPRCGGKLVLREGVYGSFYGCSNYPKCTFKKPLD